MKRITHKLKMAISALLLHLRRWLHLSQRLNKTQLLNSLKVERAELEAIINTIDEAKMVETGVQGNWSVKDLMAHIATWDKRGTNWIRAASQGRVPEMPAEGYTWEDMDRLNQQTFLEYKDRSLLEVSTDFCDSYAQLLKQVQSLSEQQAARPLVAELITWRYGHYRTHCRQIRIWLNRLPKA